MAQFNQNDFETTLLNRAELEQALGIKINLNNNATYLDDYAMYAELDLHTVTCLFIGLHPENWDAHEHPRYNTIFNAIKQSAETGKITARIEQDKNGFNYIFLNHDTIRQYAQTYNLQWNVPPYKAVEINTQTADNSELVQQLTAKDEEIARLKAEIDALKLQVQSTQGNEPTQGRTSQPQRDLLTLLVMNCYGERQSRNDLFNAINADLRAKGIRTSEIKYSTLDKLIDEEIRINNKSPFPPKQK
ncbi:hypothetical protein [Bibersteinia trehalosi]|uniref:hypothetical protein n=1 Tax=Bibersteinia trehalosi TaxID=47735 RepID=UPI0040459A59